jgi:cell division protein FtsZ
MQENVIFSNAAGPRVKILGIGGAGTHALAQIAKTELGHLPMTAIHTHARVLQQAAVPHRILIGVDRKHGLGTGGDSELARVMASAEAAKLQECVADCDLLFLVAGLGGGTGTGIAPVVARLAKECGALVVALVTLPYDFEGPRRQKQALAGVQTLRAEADAVICVPNQKTSRLLDANTTVLDAFAFTNEMLAEAMTGIYQMLTRPGLINVDFEYLCSVLRGRHVESALATARASGDHRAREVVDKILASPLLDGGRALLEADQVLASVVASQNLTMAEINKIMEQLGRHAEQQRIVLGTAIDSTQSDYLSLTVIAAKNGKVFGLHGETAEPAGKTVEIGESSVFLDEQSAARPAPRFVAPPPESTPEKTRHLLETQPNSRKKKSPWKQELLALEIVSRGRFEKSEPTIHRGADLDVPTYIRRGVPLN